MAVDEDTQATIRALWAAGQALGHPPVPVPEADPWDEPSAGVPRGAGTAVLFDGVPEVVVRLHGDGTCTVQVEQVVDLEVPRADVVAVVEAVLAGRVRRRARARGWGSNLVATLLGSPAPTDLVVVVDEAAGRRTYTAAVPFSRPPSGWLQTRPLD